MKKVKVLLLILVLLCLCGCSLKKENVKLFSDEEAVKYAEKAFGKCQLVSSDRSQNDSVKFTFVDEQYKFNYIVTSEIEEVKFLKTFYHSRESSDFDEVYYNYILNNLSSDIFRIQNEKSVKIVKREKVYLKNMYTYDKNLFDIYSDNDDLDKMKEASSELIESIKKIDTRNYYKNYFIYLYSSNQEDEMGDKKILDKIYLTGK